MSQLTQKEKTLLKDQKEHENICIKKYADYANQTQDQQLKQIFTKLGQQEQEHLNTVNQILNGQVPNMNQQGQQGQQSGQNQNVQNNQAMQSGTGSKKDADLCADMLMAEKFVSGAYNTAIFEFRDSNIRQALNHIQKEEQQHGEEIFNYMQSKGLYNIQ